MIPVATINQRCEHSHSFEQIPDWPEGDGARLLDKCDPAGRFDGCGGIEFSSPLNVSALVGANIVNQRLRGVRNRARIRLKIIAEKRGTVLIDNLAFRLFGQIDRGEAAADAFDQDGDTDKSDCRLIRSPNCADEIGSEAVVRRARVHGRDVEVLVLCARRPATNSRSDRPASSPDTSGIDAIRRPSAVVMNIPSICGWLK